MTWLALLGVKAKVVLGGLVGSILSALVLKFGPELIQKKEDEILLKISRPNLLDPEEKKLWMDFVCSAKKLIAYKLPSGLGDQKKTEVESYLAKFIPRVAAHVLTELLDQAEINLDKKLEEPAAPGN